VDALAALLRAIAADWLLRCWRRWRERSRRSRWAWVIECLYRKRTPPCRSGRHAGGAPGRADVLAQTL